MTERSNAQILTATAIAIVLGAIMSWAGSDGGDRFGAIPVFALCGLLAFAINWLAFIPCGAGADRALLRPRRWHQLHRRDNGCRCAAVQ